MSIHIFLSLKKYPWHNPESKEYRIKNEIDAYCYVNLKHRTFIHDGFKKIYKLGQLLFLWDEECLPGKINVNLRSKIRDTKTPVNKATVDNAKETKINNNHKSRNEFCFKKKTLHNEKRVLLLFVKFLVNSWFAQAKISVE